jgi:ATP-dependent RNA helicase RhlE
MSAITFADLNLNPSLQKALNDMGYERATTIQERALPVVMSGRDVCGIAQTGTGKTFAYLLPLLRQWTFTKDPYPQILILVPTRELVLQVTEAVQKLSSYMNVVTVGIFGGANMAPQAAAIEKGCDVVVATPGRLLDLILGGFLKTKGIKKLVIDEVDEMLNLGFRAQIQRVIDLLPPRRQNLMFSATITDEVDVLLETFFNDPVMIEAAPTGTPLEGIEQAVYNAPNFYTKIDLLQLLLLQDPAMTKVLVFTATKKLADDIYEAIAGDMPEQVGIIHSNKEQNHRFNTVRKFATGEYRVLIATDIVARGIDISAVSHVINFDLPEVPEHYIHRIGRTGRADAKGLAFSFVTPRDEASLEAIEALMNYKVPVLPLPDDVEISDVLTEDEKPKVHMKTIQIKQPKREGAGTAFHEKSARNRKINVKVRHTDKMKEKYGKPKTRGGKKK